MFKHQGRMLHNIKEFLFKNNSFVNQESLKEQDTLIDESHLRKNAKIISEGDSKKIASISKITTKYHPVLSENGKLDETMIKLVDPLRKFKDKNPESFKKLLQKADKIKNQHFSFYTPK